MGDKRRLMFKRIGVALSLVAAFMFSGTAFAMSPASVPLPASLTRIHFVPGTSSYTFTANLAQGVPQGFVLAVSSHQSIYVTKTGNATAEMLDTQNSILGAATSQPGPWGVTAAQSGDYTLVLDGQGSVTVSLYIPSTSFSQSYSSIVPLFQQRIHFAPGATGFSFSENFNQGLPAAFLLGISGGQQLNIVTQGTVTAAVLGPDNNSVGATSSQRGQWAYNIPVTGDYTLVLSGSGLASVSISIPPLSAGSPTGGVTRIRFLPGNTSFTTLANQQNGSFTSRYVLGIAAGQTLYVSTSGSTSGVQVLDPFGSSLPSFAMPNGSVGFHIRWTGDYRVVVSGSGMITVTFYIPPL